MHRVIFNQKGGVGKSTITCNLAALSAAAGQRTLVLDLDPQGNSTQYLLGLETGDLEKSLADFFEEMLRFSFRPSNGFNGYVQTTPFENLDIAPAHPNLSDLQDKLESRYKMYKLRETLEHISEYDQIYIDTPPALNFYTRSALIAVNRCLIPFDCDQFARSALYNLLDNVKEIQQDHNPDLQVEGIVVNQFQARANLPQQIVADLISEGLPVLDTYLSSSVKIRESHQNASPMIHFAPTHKLTLEFQALHDSLNNIAAA